MAKTSLYNMLTPLTRVTLALGAMVVDSLAAEVVTLAPEAMVEVTLGLEAMVEVTLGPGAMEVTLDQEATQAMEVTLDPKALGEASRYPISPMISRNANIFSHRTQGEGYGFRREKVRWW